MNDEVFRVYNSQFKDEWKKIRSNNSWVICPTNNHDGVSVWWNEEDNALAVISNVWPHSGYQEYQNENGNYKFVKEHFPWEMPDYQYGWHFIGEL